MPHNVRKPMIGGKLANATAEFFAAVQRYKCTPVFIQCVADLNTRSRGFMTEISFQCLTCEFKECGFIGSTKHGVLPPVGDYPGEGGTCPV